MVRAMGTPPESDALAKGSLSLGIVSSALVFGIGLCAFVGVRQGTWIRAAGTPLFVCGASTAFLGLVGALLGMGALVGPSRSKTTGAIGLLLSTIGVCLLLGFLAALRRRVGP